jgi:hypothetical protein
MPVSEVSNITVKLTSSDTTTVQNIVKEEKSFLTNTRAQNKTVGNKHWNKAFVPDTGH